MAKTVLLDTDIGGDIDDTWALATALRCPEIDLRLVTTVTSDTQVRARIVAKLLDIDGRGDIDVGIGPFGDGSGPERMNQGPWVADYDLDAYSGRVHADGVAAMIDLVEAAAGDVTLVSIGPTGNIAEFVRRRPDLAPRCHFVGMHGSVYEGYAPGSPPTPETNVRLDVPSMRQTLAAPWKTLKLTPLDTCGRLDLDGELYRRVYRDRSPLVRALMRNYEIFAPRVSWMECDFFDRRSTTLFDNVAVHMAYSEDFLEFEEMRLSVTDDGLTRIDPAGAAARVAIRWTDMAALQRDIVERLCPA